MPTDTQGTSKSITSLSNSKRTNIESAIFFVMLCVLTVFIYKIYPNILTVDVKICYVVNRNKKLLLVFPFASVLGENKCFDNSPRA